MLALGFTYWIWDKEMGKELAFTLLVNGLCNNILKGIFRLERPIGQKGIRTLRQHTATGYSFPSGHSQNAAALYLFPARRKGGWMYLGAAVIGLGVGLSRLYLGVHYPKDVVAGLALGAAAVFICPVLWRRFSHEKMLAMMAAVCLILTLFLGQGDLYKAFGLLLGFWGGIVFERKFVDFSVHISGAKKALRLLCGLALCGGLAFLCKRFFPAADLWDTARYALLSFFALGLYPFFFHRFGF